MFVRFLCPLVIAVVVVIVSSCLRCGFSSLPNTFFDPPTPPISLGAFDRLYVGLEQSAPGVLLGLVDGGPGKSAGLPRQPARPITT